MITKSNGLFMHAYKVVIRLIFFSFYSGWLNQKPGYGQIYRALLGSLQREWEREPKKWNPAEKEGFYPFFGVKK